MYCPPPASDYAIYGWMWPVHQRITVSASGPKWVINQTKQAAQRTASLTGLNITYIGDNRPADIRVYRVNLGTTRAGQATWTLSNDQTTILSSRIDINRSVNWNIFFPNQQQDVFMHEFGHAVGLKHVKDRSSLMYGGYRRNVKRPVAYLSWADIYAFSKVGVCR